MDFSRLVSERTPLDEGWGVEKLSSLPESMTQLRGSGNAVAWFPEECIDMHFRITDTEWLERARVTSQSEPTISPERNQKRRERDPRIWCVSPWREDWAGLGVSESIRHGRGKE
jgi:hypothetical protein